MQDIDYEKMKEKIKALYAIVDDLEKQFPGRHFTPDGHLVGSIGEVFAAGYYGLKLLQASSETHDAISQNGTKVQIKATQIKSVSLSSEPDHLIVLQILQNGDFQEIYNGPGKLAWDATGKMQKNGQRRVSVLKLKDLMNNVPMENRLEINA